MSYKMLMRNVLTDANYSTPTTTTHIGCERLIVERIDGDGAFLTITLAGKCQPSEIAPPKYLPLGSTLVGTLIRTDPSSGIETFIFNRSVPQALSADLPSPFFPSDGCVEVQWTGSKATLKATSRHFHDLSETGVVIHKPEPFEEHNDGKAWLFDAISVPWESNEQPTTQGDLT
jgi:hypothetical protein